MSDPQVPSPYGEDDLDDLLGSRVAIQSTPLDWFKTNTNEIPGNDKQVPYEDELAHDPETGAIYVLTRDDAGNVVPKSHSVDIYNKIREMEESGIFDNAMAFIFNKEIYKLYFDSERLTVKAGEDIVFDKTHRYYGIRSSDTQSDGAYRYYTGIRANDGSGEVLTNFVDMEPVKNAQGVVTHRIFGTGALLEPLSHGKNYIVEFYDEDKILIRHLVFQAVGVRYMTFDMTPDMAVVDIKIISDTMPIGSNEGTRVFLRQGQSYKDLNFKVNVVYSDGKLRDISHELGTKLIVEGLEDITTDKITGTEEEIVGGETLIVEPQTFKITYYLSQSAYIGENVNPTTLSIEKDIEVYIIPDTSAIPQAVIPVARKVISGVYRTIELKFYAFYVIGLSKDEGVMRDITPLVRNNTIPAFTYHQTQNLFIGNETAVQSLNTFEIIVPLGNNKTQVFEIEFKALHQDSDINKIIIYRDPSVQNSVYTPIHYMRWISNTNQFKFDTYQKYTLQGQADGAKINITPTYLTNNFSFHVNSSVTKIPTHITIRHGIYPEHVFARNVAIANIGQAFDIVHNDRYSTEEQLPLIIEFNKLSYDEDILVKSECTGICSYILTMATN